MPNLSLPSPPLNYDPQNEAQTRAAIERAFLGINNGGSTGMVNPMTTAGDIIIGDTLGVPKRLGAQANGDVLTLQGGSPVWVMPSSGWGGVRIDPFWDSVFIQMHLDSYTGGVLVDKKGHTITMTGTSLSTSIPHPYLQPYTLFAGGTDKVVITTSTLPRYRGDQNFTIEFWFNSSTGTANQILFSHANGNNNAGTIFVLLNTVLNNGLLQFQAIGDGTMTGTVSHIDGLWHHVRIVRSWDVWMMFVDGLLEAALTAITARQGDFSGDMWLGASPAAATPVHYVGGLAEFRYTIGVSRGTMPYAVPLSRYPDG